jgi:hypothetical protein
MSLPMCFVSGQRPSQPGKFGSQVTTKQMDR